VTRPLTREEKIELLALLDERHRRRERKRLETERQAIIEKCSTLHGFIEEFWYVLEPVAKFRSGRALRAMCDHLEAVHYGRIQCREAQPFGSSRARNSCRGDWAWSWAKDCEEAARVTTVAIISRAPPTLPGWFQNRTFAGADPTIKWETPPERTSGKVPT
jgi:hypothetical protein